MRKENTEFVICDSLHEITFYGNGFGFSVFLPSVPQILKDKAVAMIRRLFKNRNMESQNRPIVDAELCIVFAPHMERCQYILSVYICSEGEEMESSTYEIGIGTEYYEEFKKYAQNLLNERLFVK